MRIEKGPIQGLRALGVKSRGPATTDVTAASTPRCGTVWRSVQPVEDLAQRDVAPERTVCHKAGSYEDRAKCHEDAEQRVRIAEVVAVAEALAPQASEKTSQSSKALATSVLALRTATWSPRS